MSDLLSLIHEPTSPYETRAFREAMDLAYVRARLSDAEARLHYVVSRPATDANPSQQSWRRAQIAGIRRDLAAISHMLEEV